MRVRRPRPTLLFTSAVLEQIPRESTPRFLANEFLEDDVNKFSSLANRRFPVDSLDHATGGQRAVSARYREIMAPLGLGDELRAAFRSGGQCWGFLCLHREEASLGFTPRESGLIARLSPHVGEGLRRALLVGAVHAAPDADAPGVLVLGEDRSLVATSAEGDRWLWELSDPNRPMGASPLAVEAVVARLEAIRSGTGAVELQPTVHLRTRSGRWAALHASEMVWPGDSRHVAVVVEPAKPAELAPVILLAYGLTKREGEVAQLVIQGNRTKVVARKLHISENTVEDHLKGIFGKLGVGSRGELMARVFSEHYAH